MLSEIENRRDETKASWWNLQWWISTCTHLREVFSTSRWHSFTIWGNLTVVQLIWIWPLGFIVISNYSGGVKPLLTYKEYILFYKMMSLYFLIAIIYFYLEGFTGVSVGKYLSGIRTAGLNSRRDKTHPRNIYSLLLLRSVVKATPFPWVYIFSLTRCCSSIALAGFMRFQV